MEQALRGAMMGGGKWKPKKNSFVSFSAQANAMWVNSPYTIDESSELSVSGYFGVNGGRVLFSTDATSKQIIFFMIPNANIVRIFANNTFYDVQSSYLDFKTVTLSGRDILLNGQKVSTIEGISFPSNNLQFFCQNGVYPLTNCKISNIKLSKNGNAVFDFYPRDSEESLFFDLVSETFMPYTGQGLSYQET